MSNRTERVGADLTDGPVLRVLLIFALPMVLESLIQQLYSSVDLIVIGHFIGNTGTVAVATGGEVTDLMTLLAMAVAVGAQVYISQLAGAGDRKNLQDAIQTAISFLILLSVVVVAFMLLFHQQLLSLLNCPEESRKQASEYLIITALGMPFVFCYNGVTAILRGMGESIQPMIFVATAAVVNIFADLFLVAVIPLGVAGTAIATALSQLGAFVAAYSYMSRHKDVFQVQVNRQFFHIKAEALRRILRMAVPQLIRSVSVQGSMLWVKAHVNSYGLIASSTYSIGNRVEKFMYVFVMGVDNAAGAMIGQSIGGRKLKRVKRIIWCTFGCNMLLAAAVIGIFLIFPRELYRMFTVDQEVIEFGVYFLRILASGMMIVGASSCFKSISTGTGAAALSMVLGVLDGVCRVAVCLIAYHVFRLGVFSYFWGAALCMLVPGIISFVYFISGKWQMKKLLSEV